MGWDAEYAQEMADALSWKELQQIDREDFTDRWDKDRFVVRGTRTGRIRNMDFTLSERIEALQRQREEEKRVKEFLATLPVEPMMKGDPDIEGEPNHLTPVVYWEHTFKSKFGQTVVNPKVYQYVAMKCRDGLWYTTGPKAPKGFTWHELLLWILESTGSAELPPIVTSYIEDWRSLPNAE